MQKYIQRIILSLIIFSSVFLILTPYFTSNFLDLRQQQENEKTRQSELARQVAEKKAQEDAEMKIYLMGKFDPTGRTDFALVPVKYNIAGYKMYLRKETLSAFLNMTEAALRDDIKLTITSATRNFDYQKNLWNNKWQGVTFVDGKDLSKSISGELERFQTILNYSAAPGTSRHHWGTEVDINSVVPKFFETEKGKKVYEWLNENALSFGFCQVYSEKGINRPAGYNEEKWHWSYLPLARNFTQEYKNLIKDSDISGFDGDQYTADENLIQDYVLGINPECI